MPFAHKGNLGKLCTAGMHKLCRSVTSASGKNTPSMIHISRMSGLVQTQAFWVIIESGLWKHMQYFNGFVIIQAIHIYWTGSQNYPSNERSIILLLHW